MELLPVRFQGPPQKWVLFFLGPFFVLLVFLFLLHLARGCSKKTIFIGFLHTLLKHQVTSCSNNQVKPKLPPKKCTFFFFFFSETPFFDQKQLSKTLILHPAPEIVHNKSKKTIFIGSKKVAKLLTLRWPSY